MFYRDAGQFTTSYAADMAMVPIRQDRIGFALILFVAFVAIPALGVAAPRSMEFALNNMLIPFLILSLGAIGLNLLTGYTGLLSLGSAGFMGVGAYACYKLTTWFPHVNILIWIVTSGLAASAVGVIFGLPSLRIKGFYLVVATLAAQFFLEWAFARVPWLYNYNDSGAIEVSDQTLFGLPIVGPNAAPTTRYLVALFIVSAMAWFASNIVRGRIGRMWMAVRDMDIAAELIGIRLLDAKLLAFAVSSFYIGVSGALMVFLWLGAAEPAAFDINLSFQLLFIIIIGGLGSILGAFLGTLILHMLPIVLRAAPKYVGLDIPAATVEHLTAMITGVLIIVVLIVEPHGLAQIWRTTKQKLRVWPFPY